MCHTFERPRVIREYRSPRTIRSFNKVFIFLMPILLSPYYVHTGIAALTSFIMGRLQGVQDVLDDPFNRISEGDINLGQVRSFEPSYQSSKLARAVELLRWVLSWYTPVVESLSSTDDLTKRPEPCSWVQTTKYDIFLVPHSA